MEFWSDSSAVCLKTARERRLFRSFWSENRLKGPCRAEQRLDFGTLYDLHGPMNPNMPTLSYAWEPTLFYGPIQKTSYLRFHQCLNDSLQTHDVKYDEHVRGTRMVRFYFKKLKRKKSNQRLFHVKAVRRLAGFGMKIGWPKI